MSVFSINDGLVNAIANLGTDRDKAAHNFYGLPVLSDQEAVNAYRGAWMPGKLVDIPANDATSKWRKWMATARQIERIEAEEKRLGLQMKVREALVLARLLGGAAIYMGGLPGKPDTPVNPALVKAGGLKFLTVLAKGHLSPGELENDIALPTFGQPKHYTISQVGVENTKLAGINIHPSRLVLFVGPRVPYGVGAAVANMDGWGDSVLLRVIDAIRNADSAIANIASLIFEAKVDVLSIPNLMTNIQNQGKKYEDLLRTRLTIAAAAKGNNGMLVLDSEETYASKSQTFSGLDALQSQALQIVCGAAGIPAVRFLGETPTGLSNNGQESLRNYYDEVKSNQTLVISPAMTVLDECLIRSALARRDPKVHYEWANLWQPTAKEKADIGKTTADTIKTLNDTRLFHPDALAEASVNLLVELGVVPGLDSSVEKFGRPDPVADPAPDPADQTADPAQLADAAPRSLYVSRKVQNVADLVAWAESQGLTLDDPDGLHVTLAYSRMPVDWMAVTTAWNQDANGELTIEPGGPRVLDAFGQDGSYLVLLFRSESLRARHADILEAGASWDWDEYQPHITLKNNHAGPVPATIAPYSGRIVLGPEIFEEIRE